MELAACRSAPSIAHQGSCRLGLKRSVSMTRRKLEPGLGRRLTERDAGVLVANILTLLVGEEHVGREATLWGIGICEVLA